MPAAFNVSAVVEQADRLRAAAERTDESLRSTFDAWTAKTATVMVDEIPRDSGETAESVTVEDGDGLSATIGPTNRDDKGRPVGFFINFGTGRQGPDDFIGRTAARAPGLLDDFDVTAVL